MLKNQNIICISSIDWDFIWQQHQTIMSAFAKNNNRVLFIENTGVRAPRISDAPRLMKRISNWIKSTKGFREEADNLYVFSPLILPFPYSRIARLINRFFMIKAIARWAKIMEFNNPIIWTFLPTPLVLDIADKIPHKALVYYCTDNFAATSKGAAKIVKYEKKVLELSDAVFVMARNMVDYCRSFNKNVTCIPMGVDADQFLKAISDSTIPEEIKKTDRPIIGYIGGIRDSVDQPLLEHLAGRFPEYTFMFVGPIQTNISNLEKLRNFIFTGQKAHGELANYIKHFDVCIVPYKKDNYTDNVSLAKLNEYLIMGKPVVTTELKETENFNKENNGILYMAKNYEEFAGLIEKAVKQDNESLRKKRKEIALNNGWDKKIEEMSSIVQGAILEKEATSINWQEKLVKLYKNVRLRTLRIAITLFFAWVLIFYTPFIWLIAQPLKISEKPHKADAIVVFAGGVGESGRAGQGYEERVGYAARLYKNAYAGHIIFSSGFVYFLKEPEVMKALAVSLGVPVEAIILEEKARNTEENVEFTKEILNREHWNNILLVSSPYHMKRASLVFHKIAPDISVTYTPIPNDHFYERPSLRHGGPWRQVNLQQVKGILHEYLGIIYYWLKGYV